MRSIRRLTDGRLLLRLPIVGLDGRRMERQVMVAQPAFAGIATFLRARQLEVEQVPDGTVAVTGLALDGLGEPGATREGPRGIREASVAFLAALLPSMRGALLDVDSGQRLDFGPALPLVDVGDPDLSAGSAPIAGRLRAHAHALGRRAELPVFLGGTRAISGPLLQGIVTATGKKLALLRICPTLDLEEVPHDRALAPGSSLLTIMNEGVSVGCLGTHGLLSAAEWEEAAHSAAHVVPLDEWRSAGLATRARAMAKALLEQVDGLYLSLDIRVVDGAFAAGRGRIVGGGLSPSELLDVCEALAPLPLAAVDLVEVAPPLDSTRRTEHLAFRALLALLGPRLAAAGAGG